VHSSPILLPLTAVGAAAFVIYSIVLVTRHGHSRTERGTLLSMCAMPVSMGVMPIV